MVLCSYLTTWRSKEEQIAENERKNIWVDFCEIIGFPSIIWEYSKVVSEDIGEYWTNAKI